MLLFLTDGLEGLQVAVQKLWWGLDVSEIKDQLRNHVVPPGWRILGDMGMATWMIIFPSCVTARQALKTPRIVVGFTTSAASFGGSFQEQQESLFPALITRIKINPGVRVAPQRLDNRVFGLIFEWGGCLSVVMAKGQWVRDAQQTCPYSTSPSAATPWCLQITIKCFIFRK